MHLEPTGRVFESCHPREATLAGGGHARAEEGDVYDAELIADLAGELDVRVRVDGHPSR